jgi:hypothetical protein
MSTTVADSIAGAVVPDTRKVWLSVALHTTPDVPEFLDPEIALVTAAHPRPDFEHRMLRAFNDGNKHRPHSSFGNVNADVLEYFDPSFVRDDLVDVIRSNSWTE